MDEFAMGSSTERSAFGPAKNPLAPDRVPGGSSGGSAAAVAAGIVRIALGSETGGSVRQPAAFCGVVGVKPTYGRVSRYGLVAFASSLDHIGVFGRTVSDAALGLEAIAGFDELDSTSSEADVPIYRLAALGAQAPEARHPDTEAIRIGRSPVPPAPPPSATTLEGLVIGKPREYFPDSLDASIADLWERALDRLRSLGTYVLSAGYYDAYYKKAQAVRTLIAEDFRAVFAGGINAIFTPTTPTPAFPVGAISDPYEMYLNDIFTVTANLAGVPAMSIPIGRVRRLPVGGQIITAHFDEYTMFRVAYALEAALGAEAHR